MKQQEMDKKLIIIKPHSFVDLITNSSTELFSFNTELSLEVFKEILNELIILHNKVNNTQLTFEDVFEEPYYDCGEIKLYGAYDNSIPYWIFEFFEGNFDCSRKHLG